MARDLREAIALPTPHHRHDQRLLEASGPGVLRYLGLDLEPAGPCAAGSELRLTHYLQVEASFARDHQLRVELVLPSGQIWVSEAHVPAGGRAPSSSWRPGQIWADRHTLRLPAQTDPGTPSSGTPLALRVSFLGAAGSAHLEAETGTAAPPRFLRAATLRLQ